jgi:hypothetical protein
MLGMAATRDFNSANGPALETASSASDPRPLNLYRETTAHETLDASKKTQRGRHSRIKEMKRRDVCVRGAHAREEHAAMSHENLVQTPAHTRPAAES